MTAVDFILSKQHYSTIAWIFTYYTCNIFKILNYLNDSSDFLISIYYNCSIGMIPTDTDSLTISCTQKQTLFTQN